MKTDRYPIVIAGSGISGLYCALKIAQNVDSENPVLVVTKSALGESNSYYAQGGMVAVLDSNKNDSVASHVGDTVVAGAGLSDKKIVEYISENSNEVVNDLLDFGVEFDTDINGNFILTKEAAHSVRRILHSDGDATGRKMEMALINSVKNNKKINVLEDTNVVDLIVEDGECRGLIVFDGKEYKNIISNVVILATGGLGQLYKYTTNPAGATGDGLALAYRAGAVLRDMEFVQFHPTALAIDDSENINRFLISEAVRGEGAKLYDKNGYEYMQEYDSRRELAPRDIVARANFVQMKKTDSECVFLDASKLADPVKRFPTISKKCAEFGIDISKDLIPVAPAAHYFMGGVKTDLNGETSVKNLYAIGEVASTGLHGANRLASNSLLECVVCAYNTAKYLKNKMLTVPKIKSEKLYNHDTKDNKSDKINVLEFKTKLKNVMWQNVGIFRSEKSLCQALDDVEKNKKEFNKTGSCASIDEYELRNMLITSKLVIKSALHRKESRGAHYRTDYLQTDEIAKHSEISKEKGEIYFVD